MIPGSAVEEEVGPCFVRCTAGVTSRRRAKPTEEAVGIEGGDVCTELTED